MHILTHPCHLPTHTHMHTSVRAQENQAKLVELGILDLIAQVSKSEVGVRGGEGGGGVRWGAERGGRCPQARGVGMEDSGHLHARRLPRLHAARRSTCPRPSPLTETLCSPCLPSQTRPAKAPPKPKAAAKPTLPEAPARSSGRLASQPQISYKAKRCAP